MRRGSERRLRTTGVSHPPTYPSSVLLPSESDLRHCPSIPDRTHVFAVPQFA